MPQGSIHIFPFTVRMHVHCHLLHMNNCMVKASSKHMQLVHFVSWWWAETFTVFLLRLLLRHCFATLPSTQVATVQCSAQTTPAHILQKLTQMCLTLSTNVGRVLRPKDCERLVLFLKDINLPKPDKWGTSQLSSFIQQVQCWEVVVPMHTYNMYHFKDLC